MKTTIQELDNQFLVNLDGELDTAAALETEKVLRPLYIECRLDQERQGHNRTFYIFLIGGVADVEQILPDGGFRVAVSQRLVSTFITTGRQIACRTATQEDSPVEHSAVVTQLQNEWPSPFAISGTADHIGC